MTVAWPPGKTDAITQLAFERLEYARELEHAGITRDIIGGAIKPGAVVRADEREFRLATPQLGGGQANPAPAFEGIRNERGADARLLQRRNNEVTVALGDRDHRHARDLVGLLEFWRTPDRRDDHFVPLLASRHTDHA